MSNLVICRNRSSTVGYRECYTRKVPMPWLDLQTRRFNTISSNVSGQVSPATNGGRSRANSGISVLSIGLGSKPFTFIHPRTEIIHHGIMDDYVYVDGDIPEATYLGIKLDTKDLEFWQSL
ncbi:hypothetical protein CAAN1_29S00573 [[Candida] anglica]|uniref:Uncharacterized protein n=1 Tax=[Candida] anglica TaxID=148631 RepID=A0ABP0EBR0_9ASCO